MTTTADAGDGPTPSDRTAAAKAALRDRVWEDLIAAGASRFPGARGRIPNFVGAEQAAERLRATDVWRSARTVKANPDSPQWPVRQRALEDGKILYLAVPRLAEKRPFLLLDPERLLDSPRAAASIKGSASNGRPVAVDEVEPVDLVVTGCVAAGADGARLGKGGGYSDLEYAIAGEAGLLSADTPVVTTVHEQQVLAAGEIPLVDHDLRLDLVVTPDAVRSPSGRRQPPRIRWDELDDDQVAAIPVLARLRDG